MDRGGLLGYSPWGPQKVRHYSMTKQQYQANYTPTRQRNHLLKLDHVTMRKLELS